MAGRDGEARVVGQALRVDVAGLRSLGGEVLGHGEALRRAVGAIAGGTASPSGPELAGWVTSAAVQAASQGWAEFLTGLAGRTSGAGQALIDAADGYQGVDERAAHRHAGRARYR